MFLKVVFLGEVGIVRYGVEPQYIVIAVEKRVSVLGAQPTVVVGVATVTRVECTMLFQDIMIGDCGFGGPVRQRADKQAGVYH